MCCAILEKAVVVRVDRDISINPLNTLIHMGLDLSVQSGHDSGGTTIVGHTSSIEEFRRPQALVFDLHFGR
jgi:hypothetical protein